MTLTTQSIVVRYYNLDLQFYVRELFDIFSNILCYLSVVRSQYLCGSHPDISFVGIREGQQNEIFQRRFCHLVELIH